MRRVVLSMVLVALVGVVGMVAAGSAAARKPAVVRLDGGTGNVEYVARARSQLFGEIASGRVTYYGLGAPRVVACASGRVLRTCARRRPVLGGWEWRVTAPVRLLLIGRNYRLAIVNATDIQLGITGVGTLSVDGTGTLVVGDQAARAYEGPERIELVPTRRMLPRLRG